MQRSSAPAKAFSFRLEAEHRAVAWVCLLCVHLREAVLPHASLQTQTALSLLHRVSRCCQALAAHHQAGFTSTSKV